MRNCERKVNVSWIGIGMCGVLLLGSCTQEEEILNSSSNQLVLSGRYESLRSRNHWEEEGSISSGLCFHWDNSVDGEENLSLSITNGSKFYDFGEYSNNAILGKVVTTNNPLVSQISLTQEVSEDNPLQPGDEIYSYVPVRLGEDVSASHQKLLVTMDIPKEIPVKELNSTHHLSPYIYMAGKGTINSETDFLTSNIYYRVLPAVLRFKIINLNAEQEFTPEVIRIGGDINTLATIKTTPASPEKAGSKAVEEIIYSLGDGVATRLSGVKVSATKSANTYALAFPTSFQGKRLFFELEGLYGEEKIERVAYLSGSVIPESQFKSNFCYTFNLEMDKDEFKISGVGCGDWTGSEEDLPSQPVE